MTSRRQIEEKDDAENYRVGGIAQHDAGAEKGERSQVIDEVGYPWNGN